LLKPRSYLALLASISPEQKKPFTPCGPLLAEDTEHGNKPGPKSGLPQTVLRKDALFQTSTFLIRMHKT
jgi:hypothetical protein